MSEDPGLRYAVLAHSALTDDVAIVGPYGTRPVADRAAELIRRAVCGRARSAPDVEVTVRPMRDGRDLVWLCSEWALDLGPLVEEGKGTMRGGPPAPPFTPARVGTGPPAH